MDPVDICVIAQHNPTRADLARDLRDHNFSVIEAGDAECGLTLIRHHRPSIAVCALELAGLNGIELCRTVRADGTLEDTYLIVLTECQDPAVRHRALQAGADDCLTQSCDPVEFTARLRNEFNISVAEVGGQTVWNEAVLAAVTVSSSRNYAHGLLTRVVEWIETHRLDCELVDFQIEFI